MLAKLGNDLQGERLDLAPLEGRRLGPPFSSRDHFVTRGPTPAQRLDGLTPLTCTYLARWEGFEPPTF